DLPRAIAVGESDPSLPPCPGGKVGAPLFGGVAVPAGVPGGPKPAELVAVGVGWVGVVSDLALRDRSDSLGRAQSCEAGFARCRERMAPPNHSVVSRRQADCDRADHDEPAQRPPPT